MLRECTCKKLTKLQDNYNILKNALDYSFDGIWISQKDGKILFVNKANERFYKINPEEFIGKNLKDLLKRGWFPESAALQSIKTKKSSTIKINVHNRWLYTTSIPVLNDGNEVEMVITNVRDMTEIVHLEKMHKQYKHEINILHKQIANEEKEANIIPKHIILDNDREFVAISPKSQELLTLINKIATYDSNILILGESGTGKEVTAKLIHKLSNRNNEPFFAINCSAVPENLLESELFGYEAGAFTGAKKSKPGLLELAQRGTLFLDEIGDMPIKLQSKLLRAIQEKEIIRLGSTKGIKINSRIISATNRNLAELIDTGEFREDLYYRLNVVSVKVPPLRERKEDIPPIVLSVLKQLNKKYKQNKSITPETINVLVEYEWPGNIRELENFIEKIYILNSDNTINLENIPSEISSNNLKNNSGNLGLKKALEEYEKNIIQNTLKQENDLKEAAKILKIDYSTLWRKIKKYGLRGK